MGAADGRTATRCCGRSPAAGRALSGAGAEPEGPGGGAGGRCRRDRGVRRRLGELLAEEHQLLDRREPGAVPAGRGRGAGAAACGCAATSPASSAAPTRARSRRRPWRGSPTRCIAMGCFEISLGDTIGVGTPRKTAAMLAAVTAEVPVGEPRHPRPRHLRPGAGQRADRLELGVRVVDSSVAGLGGCPYAKGAVGQCRHRGRGLHAGRHGRATGVDLDAVIEAGRGICATAWARNAARLAGL